MKKKINLENSGVRVLNPDVDFFIDKLQKKEPFKYLKICHALFDGIFSAYSDDLDELKRLLNAENYEQIGKQIAISKKAEFEMSSSFWHDKADDVSSKYETAVKVLHQYKNISNDIMIGISLGVGLGTFWGIWPHDNKIQIGRRKIAGMLDNDSYDNYFYAGLFKHYTIKKEIYKLFHKLNEFNYNVGFFGPKYFSRFEEVFNIQNFTHLEIPVVGAIKNLDSEIERIREFSNKNGNPSVVFLQCGATMACSIVDILKDDDITLIDVGRSFDLLIKDEVHKHDTMWQCWTGLSEAGLNEYVNKTRE